MNKVLGEISESIAPIQKSKTYYGKETSYTLQGGKDYRETIMVLDDAIQSNTSRFNRGGHFGEALPRETNNIYHIRYDTRFTPDGKSIYDK